MTDLDNSVRQVDGTERVTMIVSDQEMISTESVLQLEPIAIRQHSSQRKKMDIHDDANLLMVDVNI